MTLFLFLLLIYKIYSCCNLYLEFLNKIGSDSKAQNMEIGFQKCITDLYNKKVYVIVCMGQLYPMIMLQYLYLQPSQALGQDRG